MLRSLSAIVLLSCFAPSVAAQSVAAKSGEAASAPETVRAMTCNLRYWNTHDGENRWELRRHMVVGILRLHRAAIFGVQEAMAEQVRHLHHELKDHDSFGAPRDGTAGGERCTIFWDRTRFDRIGGDTFWLSETPDRPSNAWGARLRRICTWCRFRSKATGRTFFVFNTHFDHQSANARKRSAELIRQRIHDLAGDEPVLLMGDLNCDGFSEPYRSLTRRAAAASEPLLDARVWTRHDFGPKGTWSGWDPAKIGARIDYVFVKNRARVLQHAVVPHEWQGRVASDHLPVLVEVELHADAEPEHRNMVHLWRLHADESGKGEQLGYHLPEFDDRKWPAVSAGDAWERQGFDGLDGEVYLRKTIHVPQAWADRTVQFVTAGVADMYALYVNGEKVHEAGSKRESAWANRINLQIANSCLRFGKDNTFVLKVTDFGGLGGLVGHPVLLTVDDRLPNAFAESFATRRLLDGKAFEIPEDARKVVLDLEVPKQWGAKLGWLRVGLGHGHDDAGDGGAHYELRDDAGNVLRRGFTAKKGIEWMQCRVAPGARLQLVVTDEDTVFSGLAPGNGMRLTTELLLDVRAK